jgi:ribonuclease BN (tRNA processing enzyme)
LVGQEQAAVQVRQIDLGLLIRRLQQLVIESALFYNDNNITISESQHILNHMVITQIEEACRVAAALKPKHLALDHFEEPRVKQECFHQVQLVLVG